MDPDRPGGDSRIYPRLEGSVGGGGDAGCLTWLLILVAVVAAWIGLSKLPGAGYDPPADPDPVVVRPDCWDYDHRIVAPDRCR